MPWPECLPEVEPPPDRGMTPDEAVRFAFSFFEAHAARQRGRFDRELRQPRLSIELARRLGVLPEAARTVVVTGSKGKGSVARLCAWALAARGHRTGLLVSPEEREHFDRIRIDNRPIDPLAFARIVDGLRPDLLALQRNAPAGFYVPPTAIFLLVALCWWKEQGVQFCVIEGGRGARHDEIGALPADVGVVSTVLAEHLNELGPTLADVAADKLSLVESVRTLVCGPLAWDWARALLPPDRLRQVVEAGRAEGRGSDWQGLAHALAGQAASLVAREPIAVPRWATPSFADIRLQRLPDGSAADCRIRFDGAVNAECLGERLLSACADGATVLLGLPDGKQGPGLVAALQQAGCRQVLALELTGATGHITSRWLQDQPALQRLPSLNVVRGADPALRQAVLALVREQRVLLFVGVQTFLRSMRVVLGVPLCGPETIGE